MMRNLNRDKIAGVKRRALRGFVAGWAVICACMLPPSVSAVDDREIGTAMRAVTSSRAFEVPLYKSRILDVEKPVRKLSVGNPNIADILILRSNQVYVVGKALGTTNVVLWDKSNRVIATIDIEITHDIDTLKAKLHELLPDEEISVHSSQGAIVLSGEVSNPAKMDAAMALATSFAPEDNDGNPKAGKVVNLMQVGGIQQVMLEVKVAEINRTIFRALGVDWTAIGFGDNNWVLGGISDSGVVSTQSLFGQFTSGSFLFSATLNAAKNNGLAKILAEPTLTTLSGQEATFLSGGEFPIPVPGDDGSTTIEFKDFGIGMGFLPVVLHENAINLKVDITVSDLSNATSVIVGVNDSLSSFVIPSLTVRQATSTVELADGQTIAIAGLISEKVRENVDKFPGLGDVPGLGYLFRSQEWLNEESELVIFVTPHLAQPIPNDLVRLPTDAFIPPGDVEYYLLGAMESLSGEQPAAVPVTSRRGGLEGSFGHQL